MQFSGMGLMGHVLRPPSFRCISAIVRTVSISIPTCDVPRKKDRYKWIRTWFSFNNSQPDFSMVSIERCVCASMPRKSIRIPLISLSRKKEKKKKRSKRPNVKRQSKRKRKREREGEGGGGGQTFATSGGWVKMTRVKEKEGRKEDCRGIDRPPRYPATIFYCSALLSSSTMDRVPLSTSLANYK